LEPEFRKQAEEAMAKKRDLEGPNFSPPGR
jgi:hypothetical protein